MQNMPPIHQLDLFEAVFQNVFYFSLFCFLLGFLLVFFFSIILMIVRRAEARHEAEGLLRDAEEKAKDIQEERERIVRDFIEQIEAKQEAETKIADEKLSAIEERVRDRETDLQDKISAQEEIVSEKTSIVDIFDNKVQSLSRKVKSRQEHLQSLASDLIKKLTQHSGVPLEEVSVDLQKKLVSEQQIETSKAMQLSEEDAFKRAEVEAKRLLTMAINRFARAYCPERGIGYLNFESEDQKNRLLADNQIHLRTAEKLCGVDLAYDEPHNAINVYGFDPVRRELGRSTVEKMMTERQLNSQKIEQIVAQNKKNLFQKILNDGQRIAKELRIENLHPEVKNMMGALRYRYSFTQNQYFHCAEVGFLAGLLAAELNVPLKDARRAGLLHDIGKAMDHSTDGGHAVIGADFIKQHGEADHIVHAVRSHHFDETPSTDLAYVVIAADAISGARPGARRSTVQSYTQKIQDLQTIARSFAGVVDTHVLSAGREIRVYVDGHKLDDWNALNLSKQIAEKIESDMQYPGQIKVTVVRETQAIEYAR
jgi:ribonuclease Y